MMAGRFGGLALSWSARCTSSFLPVGEALGHPRICGCEAVGSGCCGLGKVWGAAHHGPAHTGASEGGRRQGSPSQLSAAASLDSPTAHRQHPITITTNPMNDLLVWAKLMS